MRTHEVIGLTKQTFSEWTEDKAPRLGAALAYYAVFSIPPLLFLVIAIIGLVYRGDVAGAIQNQLGTLIGESTARTMMETGRQQKAGGGFLPEIAGIALLLFGASGVFGELQDVLNTIWGVQPKQGRGVTGIIKDRFLSLAMVLGIAFLLLVSLVLSAAVTAIGGWLPGGEALGHVFVLILSFGVTTVLFAMIFKVLPDVKLAWSDVWIGADRVDRDGCGGAWHRAHGGRLNVDDRHAASRVVSPIMLQRWHEISFFHWSCDPALVQHRLPAGLEVDTFDGKAWISLTPFLLSGLRPPFVPHSLGMEFPEMNLRTYVNGPAGPAIWFFSLDAAKFLAVTGARISFGLPYFWSDMHVEIGEKENFYFSNRRGRAQARIRIAKEERITEQSHLDLFLTARFRLYSTRRGRLVTAEVQHPPWELNALRVLEFQENVRGTMGVEFPTDDFLCHHSRGVETKIGAPEVV